MAFIQIVEGRTADVDAVAALGDEWAAATEGRRTSLSSVVTRDRDDPDRFLIIVTFDSYESAMTNSELPETQELSQKMAALLTAEPIFHNLDVVQRNV